MAEPVAPDTSEAPELAQPSTAGAPGPAAAPPAAPVQASTPEEPKGAQLLAHSNIRMATKVLQSALASFDLGSREGKTLLSAVKSLVTAFGSAPGEGIDQATLAAMAENFAKYGQAKPATVQ